MYYRGASAALICFDVTNADSFTGAKTWIEELRRQATPDIVIGLAGNKCDMTHREVTTAEAQTYAQQNSLIFFETSAKTGENIHTIFREIGSWCITSLVLPFFPHAFHGFAAVKLPKTKQVSVSDDIQILSPVRSWTLMQLSLTSLVG